MKINKIEIKNFYSIKKLVLNFDKFKGVILLEGKNKDTGGSNGSGKSAIIEAVVWGLFGRTIRKSTEEALVNSQSKKECYVKITVNNNVVIQRGKKPTYLRYIVGTENKSQANALETQKLIESTLHTNYKVFLASTVFGQQNTLGFINATPEDKRTIIKNFLNLDNLFALRESVKYLKSQYSQKIKALTAICGEHQQTVDGIDLKIKTLDKLKKDVEGKYEEDILSLPLQEIVDAENLNSSLDWKTVNLKKISTQRSSIKSLLKEQETPPTKCDECGQKIPRANKKVIEEKIENSRKVLEGYSLLVKECKEEYQEVPLPSREYHKVIDYKDLCSKQSTFTEIKDETLQKIQDSYDEKGDLNNNYEIMRFWEKAFSESGLVKYIIRNILNYLNGKVNFYLSHLSKGKFFLEFDEELKETVTHQGREIHYISLSGGEKRKIDLAVLLGLQQLLAISSTEESNLMFFDEIAENLDQDGLDGLYILVSELKKEKTLFVITHNNYLKSLMDNVRTLTITKNKGVSSLGR